jgi:hypothetical protein
MDGFLYPFSTGEKTPDLEDKASNVRLSMSYVQYSMTAGLRPSMGVVNDITSK